MTPEAREALRRRQEGSRRGNAAAHERQEAERREREAEGDDPQTMDFDNILIEFLELNNVRGLYSPRCSQLRAEMNRRCPSMGA